MNVFLCFTRSQDLSSSIISSVFYLTPFSVIYNSVQQFRLSVLVSNGFRNCFFRNGIQTESEISLCSNSISFFYFSLEVQIVIMFWNIKKCHFKKIIIVEFLIELVSVSWNCQDLGQYLFIFRHLDSHDKSDDILLVISTPNFCCYRKQSYYWCRYFSSIFELPVWLQF